MDHLVCGDVGFGKKSRPATAAMSGDSRSAAFDLISQPARQHHRTFVERFRFRYGRCLRAFPSPLKPWREGLEDGTLDYRHRHSRPFRWKTSRSNAFGLVIIKRGVALGVTPHKERLRRLRPTSMLTLTAILRIAANGNVGFRRVSVNIQTPVCRPSRGPHPMSALWI
jgi:transcription-repair coupling factor (superfamily II helicase)